MKKLFLLICLSFILKTAPCQSFIETEIQNVVRTQIFTSSVENVTLLIPVPYFFIPVTFSYLNNNIYFDTDKKTVTGMPTYSALKFSELNKHLPLKFSCALYPNEFRLNTFLDDNLPVSIDVLRRNDEIDIKVSTNNGEFRREVYYKNDKLMNFITANIDGSHVTNYEYSPDKTRIISFSSSDKLFKTIDQYFSDNKLSKQIIYRESTKRDDLRLRSSSNFSFDSENRIIHIESRDHKNRIIDSTSISYYTDSKIELYKNNYGVVNTACYYDSLGRITSKVITDHNNYYKVTYIYDNKDRISIIDIDDVKLESKTRYAFIYIGDFFIEFQEFTSNSLDQKLELKKKITFNYNKEKFLENVSVMNAKGQVEKRLRYEMNK